MPGSVPVELNTSLSNSVAAALNLKKTSEGEGESRERIEAARNGGICCALVKLVCDLPGVAPSRSAVVLAALRVVQVGAVISVILKMAVGLYTSGMAVSLAPAKLK